MAAQRLLPALQQIYAGWSTLRGRNASIKSVLEMLNKPLPSLVKSAKALERFDTIRLSGVYFSYDENRSQTLNGISVDIRKGEIAGIIGTSGSGKSTTRSSCWPLKANTWDSLS